jgi:coenzyme PQQ synthesis protein D (PqqD)
MRQDRTILQATVSVPEHVVHREFAEETVALNLERGTYHGLNPTAARMLEVLGEAGTIGSAVAPLALEFEQEPALIEQDLVTLCRALHERGLVELHGAGGD